MLFNSLPFIFGFLPIAMLGFHLLGRFGRRPVIAWLAIASVFFYSRWNHEFAFFLLGSIVINYLISVIISKAPDGSSQRRQLLFAGVSINLLALFYFKYLFHFLAAAYSFQWIKQGPHPILLPIGISFFTFTQISYLIDLAQGQAERQDFASYLLFVTFFPHLVAGPILHHKEMMPQFGPQDPSAESPLRPLRRFALKADDVSLGLTWFLMGLAKKVLVADNLSATADKAFAHAGSLDSAAAFTGLVAYSMQLYFDFSGYSDMAIGLARVFSIRFPLNFDSPFKATSVTEYWQRWHISLTRFITLYLYNPLLLGVQRRRIGRGLKISRKSLATPTGFASMVAYPTLLTMLLTGLWHGAGLQFVVFGLIHGVYLTLNQAWRHFRWRLHTATPPSSPTGATRLLMMVGVYLQVCFALIFFRASSLHDAGAFLADLAGAHGAGSMGTMLEGALAFALFPIVWFMPNTQQILGQENSSPQGQATTFAAPALASGQMRLQAPSLFPNLRWKPSLRWSLVMAGLLFAVLVQLNPKAAFLYFQF